MTGDVTLGALLRYKAQLDTSFQFVTDATATAHTLTGPQVAGSLSNSFIGPDFVTVALTGTLAAAAALTLPTAAALLLAIPNAFVNMVYRVRFINQSSGNFAWTITTNTGNTIAGGGAATIAENTWREYDVKFTGIGANAAVTYTNVGTGAWS